jgi:uncharacterized membrane protein HdeD (DUF308 family)
MRDQRVRHWWVLALRGVLAILFGLIALVWPDITLMALVRLFGAYAFVDGIFSLMTAASAADGHERWGALLLEALVGMEAGISAFVWPGMAALALRYLMAGWALATGTLKIAAAVQLRQLIAGEWVLGVSGVLTVLLGTLLAVSPGAGLLAWVWMVGSYAVLFGMLLLALAFRLRHLSPAPHPWRRAAAWRRTRVRSGPYD